MPVILRASQRSKHAQLDSKTRKSNNLSRQESIPKEIQRQELKRNLKALHEKEWRSPKTKAYVAQRHLIGLLCLAPLTQAYLLKQAGDTGAQTLTLLSAPMALSSVLWFTGVRRSICARMSAYSFFPMLLVLSVLPTALIPSVLCSSLRGAWKREAIKNIHDKQPPIAQKRAPEPTKNPVIDLSF